MIGLTATEVWVRGRGGGEPGMRGRLGAAGEGEGRIRDNSNSKIVLSIGFE